MNHLLVIKAGGAAGLDLDACARDIAAISAEQPVVLIHGVSAALDALCAERGAPVRTLTSPSGHVSRYTDAATRDLYVEAAGRVGQSWVDALARHGAQAQVASPAVTAERKDALRAVIDGRVRIVRDDYTGSITGAETGAIATLLNSGLLPVVPPVAVSPDGLLNVDGDRTAAALAAALGAHTLLILSNVRGLYRDPADPDSLVVHIHPQAMPQALDWAAGRMKRKVIAAQDALAGGVARVVIGDGRRASPVRDGLAGIGTVFSAVNNGVEA
ncbi:MAG: [LysW]-aminoadipate kinase [Anaerolineae bacterium]|nr:[LysW]-aminoadipate kinase [Anaerolineae bacterium]